MAAMFYASDIWAPFAVPAHTCRKNDSYTQKTLQPQRKQCIITCMSDKARGYVESLIEKCRASSEHRLPSIADMTRRSGIPRGKIEQAISWYRRTGVLDVRQRSGIRLRAPGDKCRGKKRGVGARSDAIHQALLTEIRRGDFDGTGALPSTKQLCARFGASPPTVRTALGRLESDGWVTRRTRTLLVHTPRGTAGGPHEVLFYGVSLERGISMNVPRFSRDLIHALDVECSKRRCRLRLRGIPFPANDMTKLEIPREDDALGVCVWAFRLTAPQLYHAVGLMLPTQPRVCVMDNQGVIPHPGHIAPRYSHIPMFSVGHSEQDGYRAGLHLLRLGHQRIAYVTHLPGVSWSERRLSGLRKAAKQTGNDIFVGHYHSRPAESGAPSTPRAGEASRGFRDALVGYDGMPQARSSRALLMSALMGAREYLAMRTIATAIRPVLDRVLGDGCSGWLCANDTLGALASEYLGSRGIRIPGQCSILSFDDSDMALSHRLSSYNFNARDLAGNILDRLLHHSPSNTPMAVQDTAGYITDRGSTGPAPK